ncbi:MAG: TrkH family potassium uptake protein [Alphaproteobacteria bacterium]|nr:TrkH family potassium uptake protein [Alphaproteobacteria bacterium]
MRFGLIFSINALMLMGCGLLMLIPAIADALTGQGWANAFTISSGITLLIGLFLYLICPKQKEPLHTKEMFLTTTLMWLLYAVFSAMPFYFPPHALTLTDAFFESMSGLTGTGATIFSNLESESTGILLWRSMSQWFGAMGIIVITLIVLPTLKIGGMQLFSTESSMLSERINPTMRQSIRDILIYFVFLSLACTVALWAAGMTPFDAVNHAMTTLSTGGFSTHDASIMYFNRPAIQWVIIFFMIMGGLPIVLGPHLFYRRWEGIYKNVQIFTFFKVLCCAVLLLIPIVGIDQLRLIIFQVVSIVTTTGFVATPYSTWGSFAATLFLFLLVCGACSGSTSGGIKMFRFAVIGRIMKTKLKSTIKPYAVFMPRYGDQIIDTQITDAILLFLGLFFITFIASTLGLAAIGLDYMTAFSGSLSCIANVGPGLGNIIGPEQTYANLPAGAKWILSFVMLAGRLEFTSLVVLFLPFLWRRNT